MFPLPSPPVRHPPTHAHTYSHPDTAGKSPKEPHFPRVSLIQALNSARGTPAVPSHAHWLAQSLTFLVTKGSALGKGPRPLPAKDQVSWVGPVHQHSLVLPLPQTTRTIHPLLMCLLPFGSWSQDVRMRAQPARTCLYRGRNSALSLLLLSTT